MAFVVPQVQHPDSHCGFPIEKVVGKSFDTHSAVSVVNGVIPPGIFCRSTNEFEKSEIELIGQFLARFLRVILPDIIHVFLDESVNTTSLGIRSHISL